MHIAPGAAAHLARCCCPWHVAAANCCSPRVLVAVPVVAGLRLDTEQLPVW